MNTEHWHPYNEPPDNARQVMLRFDPEGIMDCTGFWCSKCGGYAKSDKAAAEHRFVHPTHWREMKGNKR